MTNELEVLKSVETENTITQRELAKRTGLSLGSVNVLIKRLIHKGLLKIEHVNAKTLRYILTPKGMMEKARLTYKYIVISYNHISRIEYKLEQIIDNKEDVIEIGLHGEKDELYDIITSKLKSMDKPFIYISDQNTLDQYKGKEYIIITWNPEHIENLADTCLNVINILSIQ